MQLLSWLQERVDAWLTPGILAGDPHEVARARLAVLMGLTTMVWGPVFVGVYLALDMAPSAGVVAAATLYLGAAPWALRASESTELAAHHTASALWFVIVGLCLQSGGIHSSALPWLVSCSFLGVAVGGWRPGLVWLVVTLLSITGFVVADVAGVSFGETPPGTMVWLRGSSLLGATLFVFTLVAVFQMEHDAMGRRLEARLDELSEANRAKSLFLANMSHELRTPMNAILGYAELVHEELEQGSDPTMAEDLVRVQTAGRHLLALIDDLLDLSRIEVGAMELDLAEHGLDDVVREVLDAIAPYAQSQQTELTSEIDGVSARCDRLRAAQIVTNIVHNAVKFTGRGRVAVRCFRDGERAVVEVRDTGPGMSEEELERVFDEFQQAHPAVRANHGGTGLGLAISRRLAQSMGGEVQVRSELGEGSVFRVELPLA